MAQLVRESGEKASKLEEKYKSMIVGTNVCIRYRVETFVIYGVCMYILYSNSLFCKCGTALESKPLHGFCAV